MAGRKPWDTLSPAYRERLTKKGITPQMHASGANIRAARGHRGTPEHRITREKATPQQSRQYREYLLKQAIGPKKVATFGEDFKYKPKNAMQNIVKNPATGKAPKQEYIDRFLSEDFDPDEIDWSDPEWGFLYYH